VSATVRAYRSTDLPALYDICVRTAASGGDARGVYASDRLVGDIFAVPYATFEPQHTHVLDDGTGTAVGYVLGTSDTPAFVRWYRDVWIPATADRCPPPADPPVSPDDPLLAMHHHPERMLVPGVAAWPAHLHIDVLPEFQGGGWGRALITRFLDGLHRAGVPAVHLGMSPDNVKARAFYDRLGFTEIAVPALDTVTFLGRATAP
jgi:ribosomal protein S18 acetylase RimI-like enzyme